MIVFDLECQPLGHRFEGWFASSEAFARQRDEGLLACPKCGAFTVFKAVMAPAIARKGNQLSADARKPSQAPRVPVPLSPGAAQALRRIAAVQAEALKTSRWVGDRFAEDARAMHYGERAHETIHGQATPDVARELIDEGVIVAPLVFPVVPPGEAN